MCAHVCVDNIEVCVTGVEYWWNKVCCLEANNLVFHISYQCYHFLIANYHFVPCNLLNMFAFWYFTGPK